MSIYSWDEGGEGKMNSADSSGLRVHINRSHKKAKTQSKPDALPMKKNLFIWVNNKVYARGYSRIAHYIDFLHPTHL